MIKQVINHGSNTIRIESAESLEDAKENNFATGQAARFFVNDKAVNYSTLIHYIIDVTKNEGERFIPDQAGIKKIKTELLERQKQTSRDQLEQLRQHYKDLKIDDKYLKKFDEMFGKIDDFGIRVLE